MLGHSKKIRALLSLCESDDYLCAILMDLTKFGYKIKTPFFGNAGDYQPYAIATNSDINDDFLEIFKHKHEQGQYKAEFKLSFKRGFDGAAHTFIHELIHFHQDMYGLFLTPLINDQNTQLEKNSYIALMLFCEALAQTEAIRASWRLQNKNISAPWHGALKSKDWGALAAQYAAGITGGMAENDAADRCFKAWYKTPAKDYYWRRANKGYKQTSQNLRGVNLTEILELLPKNCRPNYINDLRSPNYIDMNWQDIKIGSPPYLWKKYLA